MKKVLVGSIVLLGLFTVTNITYASEKYKQTIKLNVSGDKKDDVCFTTSDVFDGKHCGASASNKYNKGPKNYYLFLKKGSIKKDTGCSKYFDESHKQRTPDSEGTLTISLNANTEAGYTSVTNCYISFQ